MRELEVGQADVAARRLDRLEVRQQRRRRRRLAADAAALLEVHQVRLGVEADAVAGRERDRLEHRAGRALAVGAGDDDHRAGEGDAEPRLDRARRGRASSSIVFGCSRSQCASQSASVIGVSVAARRRTACRSGDARQATRRQLRCSIAICRAIVGAQLAPVDDHVDRAGLRAGTRRAGSPRAASRARCSRSRAGRRSRSAPSARR